MFDVSIGNMINTYKCNVDKHIIEIELWNSGKNDFIKIWYSYNNNYNTTTLYYNAIDNNLYGARITDRQAKMIINKIKSALKVHNK
jgi:hypothetical protein